MEVKNDKLLIRFLKDRQVKDSTKINYISHIGLYCKITGLTPTQLIEEAEDEEDQNIKPRLRKIKEYLDNYQDHLIKKNTSPSRIKIAISVVKHFYKHYDITVPTNNVYKKNKQIKHDIGLIPSIEDIRHAMQFVTDTKYQGIIKLIMSSGMGRSEVLSLKVSDFVNSVSEYIGKNIVDNPSDIGDMCQELLKRDEVIPEWRVVRVKIAYPYITFSNTESVHSICEYLLKKPPESIDDFLFRSPGGGRISNKAFNIYFNRVNQKARFENKERLSFFRSHNLRKFFATTLMKHRMSKWDIDRLMGHVVKDQDDAYFKIDPKTLKNEYMKHVKYLSLERVEYKRVETQEYKELIHEMDQKDKKIAAMEKKQEVLERMVKELMEKQLD